VEHGRFPYLGFARRKSKEDIAIVNQSMAFAHVDSYANQYVDTLSGGIRQRAFFAMTLAQDCDYVVLDEPTTYLDLRGQQDFLVMVKELKEQGKTIILILHDLGQALRISDRLVVMEPLSVPSDAQHMAFAGTKIAACGTPAECLRQHIIENVFHTRIKQFSDEDGIYYFFE
jgi:iron complex transport system ATP-binding protein